MTFRIGATWKRGKFYGFLYGRFRSSFASNCWKDVNILCENLVTKFQTVVEKMKVKLWFWAYFIFKVWNLQMEPAVVDNFVAWEEQIIMLKTGSKSFQKWRRYNRLKFGGLRKRIWEVCWLTAWQLVKPDMTSCGDDNYGLQCITAKGSKCDRHGFRNKLHLDSTCNKNFDGEFGEL